MIIANSLAIYEFTLFSSVRFRDDESHVLGCLQVFVKESEA